LAGIDAGDAVLGYLGEPEVGAGEAVGVLGRGGPTFFAAGVAEAAPAVNATVWLGVVEVVAGWLGVEGVDWVAAVNLGAGAVLDPGLVMWKEVPLTTLAVVGFGEVLRAPGVLLRGACLAEAGRIVPLPGKPEACGAELDREGVVGSVRDSEEAGVARGEEDVPVEEEDVPVEEEDVPVEEEEDVPGPPRGEDVPREEAGVDGALAVLRPIALAGWLIGPL
jgi:hypothetical protein